MKLTKVRFSKSVKYSGGTRVYDIYHCECGNLTEARRDHAKAGKVVSCGCLRDKQARKNLKKITRLNYGNVNGGGCKKGQGGSNSNKGKTCLFEDPRNPLRSRRVYLTEIELAEIYAGLREDPFG